MNTSIPIRIASMGPADNGKSTLFGYIVLNHIQAQGYWDNIVHNDWYKKDRGYTYLFDRLVCERQGVPIGDGKRMDRGTSRVATHVGCKIYQKEYIFIDCPGHDRFISNATTGIFQAQTGVLVISATDVDSLIRAFKLKEEIAESGKTNIDSSITGMVNCLFSPILARIYGFKSLVIVISKMDLVEYKSDAFQLAIKELLPRISNYSGILLGNISMIPTSIDVANRTDINVIIRVPENHPMSWYKGPTVLDALKQVKPLNPLQGPLMLPIETVYLKRMDEAPLILTGRIISGVISENQIVKIIPLYDPKLQDDQFKEIEGRVKSIRLRNQSKQLPWIGDLVDKEGEKKVFEAGYIVGLNMHLNPKNSWAKKNDRQFKKGCIITEKDTKVKTGNVVRIEVFLPIFSRPMIVSQTWVTYLFGKNIGDALILKIHTLEPYINEEGDEYLGYFIKADLLLKLTIALPMTEENTLSEFPKLVLRHNDSCAGGRLLDLGFTDNFNFRLRIEDTTLEFDQIMADIKNLAKRKAITCEWKGSNEDDSITNLEFFKPTSTDIQSFYQKFNPLIRSGFEFDIDVGLR